MIEGKSTEKRACVILVADSNMAAIFRGYLTRDRWHRSMGCAHFDFDHALGGDLLVAERRDPGVFAEAHALLDSYVDTHQHAIIALDCEWSGAPPKAEIVERITANMLAKGWAVENIRVIAIDPELESWLWQDNPNVAAALGYQAEPPLRELLAQNQRWPAGQAKPFRPKETAEWVLRLTKTPRSSARYEQLASRVSIKHCTDEAFQELRVALQAWFPNGGIA